MRDWPAISWLGFHLGINGYAGFIAVNRCVNQIEVHADGFGLIKERTGLLLEQRAIFHPSQIEKREKLFLAVALERFAELQQQA